MMQSVVNRNPKIDFFGQNFAMSSILQRDRTCLPSSPPDQIEYSKRKYVHVGICEMTQQAEAQNIT